MGTKLQVSRILWVAFMMSQIIFAVVAFIVPQPQATPEPALPIATAVAAIGVAIASFLIPRKLMSQGLKQLELPVSQTVEAPDGRFGGFYRDAAGSRSLFQEPERALGRAFPVFQTAFILSVALSEAITIFGFTLAFMGIDPIVFVPFFVVGCALVAIRFPRESTIRGALERTYQATLETSPREARPKQS